MEFSLLGLLTIFDSGFPIGGFARSNGYESARQLRYITDRESLKEFCYLGLENASALHLPAITSVYHVIFNLHQSIRSQQPSADQDGSPHSPQYFHCRGHPMHEHEDVRKVSLEFCECCNHCFRLRQESEVPFQRVQQNRSLAHHLETSLDNYGASMKMSQEEAWEKSTHIRNMTKILDCVLDINEWLDATLICNYLEYDASQSQGQSLMRTVRQMLRSGDGREENVNISSMELVARWILERWENLLECSDSDKQEDVTHDTGTSAYSEFSSRGSNLNSTDHLASNDLDSSPRYLKQYLKWRLGCNIPPHFSIVIALSCISLGANHQHCCLGYLFSYLRNTISAAVRDGLIGPNDAQCLIAEILGLANSSSSRNCSNGLRLSHLPLYRNQVNERQNDKHSLTQLIQMYGGVQYGGGGGGGGDSSICVTQLESRLTCPMIDVIQSAHQLLFSRMFLS